MDDLISRQAVVDSVNKALSEYMGESLLTYSSLILDYIKALPSVQPKPKMGRWILSDIQRREDIDNGNYQYFCSNCLRSDIHSKSCKVPYCWYCGAKMVEPRERSDNE